MTSPSGGRGAAEEYAQRLGDRRARAGELTRRDRRLSNARLVVFFSGVGLALAAFFGRALSPLWLLPPSAVFCALLLVHDRVIRRRERAERAVAFYERGLARLTHAFAGLGEPGERFRDPHHPYAEDLDLFGRGSLFELLCAARTREGEERLAAWLLAPAPPDVVRARQEAIAELRERLDLREDLALLGEDVRAGLHAAALRRWGEAPAAFARPALLRGLAAALSGLSLGGLVLWMATPAGPIPLLAALALQSLLAAALRGPVARVAGAAELPARDLGVLSELLARLEQERPRSARLVALRAALGGDGPPPSRRIAQLRLRVDLLESRRNQLFAPLAALLLWKTQCALAIEALARRAADPRSGAGSTPSASSRRWRPSQATPTSGPTRASRSSSRARRASRREELGHPLIRPERCVRNDVSPRRRARAC